jgi:hypothetical protein
MSNSLKISLFFIIATIVGLLIYFYWLDQEPEIENIILTSEINNSQTENVNSSTFKPDQDIYLSFDLKNAFNQAKVEIEWLEFPSSKVIGQSRETISGSKKLSFMAKSPENGWRIGDYLVKIIIDEKELDSRRFVIE